MKEKKSQVSKAPVAATANNDDIPTMSLIGQILGRLLTNLFNIDKNRDGVISNFETMQAVQTFIMEAVLAFGNWQTFKTAFDEWTNDERDALLSEFAVKFNLENKRLEMLVERWIFAANELADLVGDTVREVRFMQEQKENATPETE